MRLAPLEQVSTNNCRTCILRTNWRKVALGISSQDERAGIYLVFYYFIHSSLAPPFSSWSSRPICIQSLDNGCEPLTTCNIFEYNFNHLRLNIVKFQSSAFFTSVIDSKFLI